MIHLAVPLTALAPGLAHSQALPPDAGAIMRETEQLRRPDVPALSPRAVPEAPVKPDPDALTFVVKRFVLTGVNLVPEQQVQDALKPWLDRPITFEELERALNAISELYQEDGWYVRPQLPAQDIVGGTVTINVIEGKLGEVDTGFNEDMPLSAERIQNFVTARQGKGDPLSMDSLARAITILNEQPGVSAQAALAPSLQPGASDVVVETMRLPAVSGSLQADNWGAKSTGYYRVTGSANWNNPNGFGDQLQATVMGSEGTIYGQLGYTLPVGYDGWRLGASVSALYYKLLGEFATLNNTGTANTLAVNATYPLVRQATSNATVTISASDAHYDNRYQLESQRLTIGKRVSLASASVTGDEVDDYFGGGFSVYGLTANLGFAKLGNREEDRLGANAHGSFATLMGNGGRLQRLTDSTSLWFSFSGQWASQNLDSSQKFSLGGPQGVRAYPVYEASGDQGWLGTVEARWDFYEGAQASVFYDMGWIQQNKNPGYLQEQLTPNTYYLKGWGVGVSYNYNNQVSMKLSVASRIGGNPGANPVTGADGDGTNDRTRVWFNVVVPL